MASHDATSVLIDGLCFGEGPRWHDGKLWFSDMHAHWVMTVDAEGRLARVVEVPNAPSGLGWLPDGRLLVVSIEDRRLLRLDATGLTEFADLRPPERGICNDMVVDARGYAIPRPRRRWISSIGTRTAPAQGARSRSLAAALWRRRYGSA